MVQTNFKTANQLLREGKLDDAVAAYREAIALNPGFSHGHHNLGEALVKVGQIDEAIAAFRQAVAINPQASWSLYKLGVLLQGEGQFQEAVGYFRQAVEQKTDVPEFYLGLGAVLVKLGQWSEAEQCLDKVVNMLYANVGKFHGTSLQTEAYYYLGAAKSGQQQWSEAVEFYRRSWEMSPGGVDCCLGLAEALGKLGQWSEAVEFYRQVVVLSGESGEVWYGLGQALGQLGRWEEAVVEYGRAISLGFAGAEVRHHLGFALGQLGRWEEAVVEYRLVLEINPKSAVVRHQLGYGLMWLGRWREAEVELRKALELHPESAVAWQQLGDVLQELGERDKAVEAYRKALEIEPDKLDAEEKLDRLLYQQIKGKLEQNVANLVEDADKAITTDTDRQTLSTNRNVHEIANELNPSLKSQDSKFLVREFHGSIDSFDRYNAHGWVASTELTFDRVRLLLQNLDLGVIPISQVKTDSKDLNYSKAEFVAHLGGILQFSAANLCRSEISLIPDKKDIEISEATPVKVEISDFWHESVTFNPLFCHQERTDFPIALQSLSLTDANELLCIFIANKNYAKKEIKIEFVQENDNLFRNHRDIEVIGDFRCSLLSEFVPLRISCRKLVSPLLIVVKDLNDVILFIDCIPYPNLLSRTNQLFTEHLCLLNNMPKNRALSRLSLQILTNQVKLNQIKLNSFLPLQEMSIVVVDLFNTQIPRELGTARENIDLLPLKECYLYQLVNPTPPFKGFQLVSYGKEPDINQLLKKIEDISLLKSFITESFKSKYTLLIDKHTILRPDFFNFVIEYFYSEKQDSIYDIFYWNSLVYPMGKTPLLLQRSSFIYPEVTINDGIPVFSMLVSTGFLAEHIEDLLRLDPLKPQFSSLIGMAEPNKVKFIPEYLEVVEVPIAQIGNKEAKKLPESKIKITDDSQLKGFHSIKTREKNLFLSESTYNKFTQLKGISIIINFRDKEELTNLCLQSIKMQKFEAKLQIILVNNRSKPEQRQSVLEKAQELFGKAAVKIIDYQFPFNHSEQCNIGAREAEYNLLVLMNNDVVLGSEDLLSKLSAYCLLPKVATVGCKVLARKPS
ncbi:MAG: tetratricopeptide repeat protein, partial [Okeania sp. SIO3B5]|uniref:tetratricopeptide repeat protein n=1 Tax=Okeania sp. SIO3B5 TaxID=2607811 RepID=UPI0013FFFF47